MAEVRPGKGDDDDGQGHRAATHLDHPPGVEVLDAAVPVQVIDPAGETIPDDGRADPVPDQEPVELTIRANADVHVICPHLDSRA